MSFSKIAALSGAIAFASKVAAHGTVTGIVADGVYYEGYHANFQYMQTQPVVVGWSTPLDQSNGFIAPDAYNSSDIICWTGATNAQTSATVAAGGTVEMQWTAWPSSHHGPVIDYLASCNGDCTTVDKTALEFFKIDGVGLLDDTTVPGDWASDTLIANNNSWTVTIPSDIAPGNYVLRHEIIALHSAGTADGAQNYPQCFNLEVTGSGTATPSGTLGTALYHEDDAGILVNIYQSLSTYEVPGPTLYSGAVSMSQTLEPSATSIAPVGTAASSAAAVTTDASSAPIATSVATTSVVSSPSSGVTSAAALQASGAPFTNGTASASKKSKSACKAKSSKSSSVPALSSITQHAKVTTTTSAAEETFATSVTIPTSSSAPTAASGSSNTGSSSGNTGSETTPETTPSTTSSTPSETSAAATEIPSGTTLSTLLSWLSSFYTKHAGTEYTGSTIARRAHARDVVRRQEMEKFDGVNFKPTGTHAGFPHGTGAPHHGHHGHGTGVASGVAQPTGFAGLGNAKFAAQGTGAAFPQGTGAAHHHHGHGHGTGVAGGAKPTGVFPSGGAFPTGSGKFRMGGF